MNNFQKYLAENNIQIEPVTFPAFTKTALQAAQSLNCSVAQIAKTIAFWAADRPLLVIASGTNRISLPKLKILTGQEIKIMNAKEVQKTLLYVIGGVPPFGYLSQPLTYLDQDLSIFDQVYAAAGTPNSVFPIAPSTLIELSQAHPADVKE